MPTEPDDAPDAPDWIELRRFALRFARRLGALPGDHEDLAQEALLLLFRHRASVRNPEGWLYVVMQNLVQRSWRSALKSRAHLADRELAALAPAGEPGDAADRISHVERALDRLPPRNRRLLLLDLQGVEAGEIAAELGVSRVNLRKLRERTRRMLSESAPPAARLPAKRRRKEALHVELP